MGISVIIPAYNAGRLIDEAIESVLRQHTSADEIIVINDGSTDRDYSILKKFHHSVRVINQCNRGVSAARNVGCEAATQNLIAILDADDIWLPEKLRAQKYYLEHNPDIDAVFCRGQFWTTSSQASTHSLLVKDTKKPTTLPNARRLTYSDFATSFCVHPSTMLVKRSVWQSIGGYNEKLKYGEDWDFYLRLSHGHQVALLDFIAMLYRQHSQSATAVLQEQNHWVNVISGTLESLGSRDRFGNEVDTKQLSDHLFNLHFMHGYEHFWHGSIHVAHHEFLRAAHLKPFALKNFAYTFFSSSAILRRIAQRARSVCGTKSYQGSLRQN